MAMLLLWLQAKTVYFSFGKDSLESFADEPTQVMTLLDSEHSKHGLLLRGSSNGYLNRRNEMTKSILLVYVTRHCVKASLWHPAPTELCCQ